jgi:hypothetical protein
VPLPDRLHRVALKTPWPLLVKLTVPVGVVAVPGEVSLTVAVHLSRTGSRCRQVRAVAVARSVTVMVAWPLLASWLLSPP